MVNLLENESIMKCFISSKVMEIDAYTIKHEPIASIDLMERASRQLYVWIKAHVSKDRHVNVFCGPGNNGGDGLALSRMLTQDGYDISVFLVRLGDALSADCQTNYKRLEDINFSVCHIRKSEDIPVIAPDTVIVDAIFGSGLSRPVEGLPAQVIKALNQVPAMRIAIDTPSGLFGEDNADNTGVIFQADHSLTIQFPNISFFMPENSPYAGQWHIMPIGLHPKAIEKTASPYYLLEDADIRQIINKRDKFAHKGHFGHALLIAGSYGKTGAAVLAAKACLRAGTGLLTVHVPRNAYAILQSTVPEAMLSIDQSEIIFTQIPDLKGYSAVGAGPGMGTKSNSQKALMKLIDSSESPLLLDADALNILAQSPEYLERLPEHSILTPHPKEFQRIFGKTVDRFAAMQLQRKMSKKYGLIIVLKGAHTSISLPDSTCYFNNTGNPGMATGGTGDVLTGIILGLIAQSYTPTEAALAGVWIHGAAGDMAEQKLGQHALIAEDILNFAGQAFKTYES